MVQDSCKTHSVAVVLGYPEAPEEVGLRHTIAVLLSY